MRFLIAALVITFGSSGNAATIYLCKAYSGGMFWSNSVCSSQKALIDRTANVPDGMPFDQQVTLAQQQLDASSKLHAQPAAQPNSGAPSCTQLSTERRALDQITEKMIWVPIEKQNTNYHRMNQIKADMARMGCSY